MNDINYFGTSRTLKMYVDNNAPWVLKYPTGKKDGNRLGKRKRFMKRYLVTLAPDMNTMVVHPSREKSIIHAFETLKPIVYDRIGDIQFKSPPSDIFMPLKPMGMKAEVKNDDVWDAYKYMAMMEPIVFDPKQFIKPTVV